MCNTIISYCIVFILIPENLNLPLDPDMAQNQTQFVKEDSLIPQEPDQPLTTSNFTKYIQTPPLSIIYVEVNRNNFQNVACYTRTHSTNNSLFHIGIIFAANINLSPTNKTAVLHMNENVVKVLSNVDRYVRPLQKRGIKVLLSILGNHQGAGFCNFPDIQSARDFATQLSETVSRYGLDGVDLDDEFVQYGENETDKPNAFSFVYFLRELRALMPKKIISFYFIGPASTRLTYGDLSAGDYLDYSWNPYYGTYSVPKLPKLGKARLSPAAVDVTGTNIISAQNLAERTVRDGYGAFMMYDLPNTDISRYLGRISEKFYGSGSTVEKGCLQGWEVKKNETGVNLRGAEGDKSLGVR